MQTLVAAAYLYAWQTRNFKAALAGTLSLVTFMMLVAYEAIDLW